MVCWGTFYYFSIKISRDQKLQQKYLAIRNSNEVCEFRIFEKPHFPIRLALTESR